MLPQHWYPLQPVWHDHWAKFIQVLRMIPMEARIARAKRQMKTRIVQAAAMWGTKDCLCHTNDSLKGFPLKRLLDDLEEWGWRSRSRRSKTNSRGPIGTIDVKEVTAKAQRELDATRWRLRDGEWTPTKADSATKAALAQALSSFLEVYNRPKDIARLHENAQASATQIAKALSRGQRQQQRRTLSRQLGVLD